MIAALPMYDHPALRSQTDAFWRQIREGLRAHGVTAPEALTRTEDLEGLWTAPDLLLAQTCGLPYRKSLSERVELVGAFDFGLPDTPDGFYHSIFVVREDDPRSDLVDLAGARLAVNGFDSQSGWAAIHDTGVSFRIRPPTGSHRASLQAIVDGDADLAAIDAVTWRILGDNEPDFVARLRGIGRSVPTPGLPLITGLSEHVQRLRSVLRRVSRFAPQGLGVTGFVDMAARDYLSMPIPPVPD